MVFGVEECGFTASLTESHPLRAPLKRTGGLSSHEP